MLVLEQTKPISTLRMLEISLNLQDLDLHGVWKDNNLFK